MKVRRAPRTHLPARPWATRATPLALAMLALFAVPAGATFPGADGRISFSGDVGEPSSVEIFAADPDGSDVAQLTQDSGFSSDPDWSPNGAQIAFESVRSTPDPDHFEMQIWTMNADGTNERQLTTVPGFEAEPAWSPTATSLAIEADWGNYPEDEGIWIIPATDPGGGDGVTKDEAVKVVGRVAGGPGVSEPQFSPDGTWIAFTAFADECSPTGHGHLGFQGHRCTSAIYRVRTDGTGLQRLTPWGSRNSYPDWSPDGRWIAFDSDDYGKFGGTSDIYLMRPDGSQRQRIIKGTATHDAAQDFANFKQDFPQNPSFSPGGSKLLHIQFLSRRWAIVVSGVDGSDLTPIVTEGFPNRADWGTAPAIP
jgi:Tol biopolymer transport system component